MQQLSDPALARQLSERALAVKWDDLSGPVRRIVGHCILDLIGLAISSANHPLVSLLREEAQETGGAEHATAVGSYQRLPSVWAATINAAAAHVLAYDDVNMTIPGHGTAVALPAALAIAERGNLNGRELMEAYVAGFETVCLLGEIAGPAHYDAGFHASATLGTFGAAVAAGRAMKLDAEALARSISIAASMAAGVKGVFGSMLKPYQVARAAGNGVLAAQLGRRGLACRSDLIERSQGFAATHAATDLPATIPRRVEGSYFPSTLFKYHAACYLTHGPIDGAAAIRTALGGGVDRIGALTVAVHPMSAKVCNVQTPETAMEIGYSIRTLAAMSLLEIPAVRGEDLSLEVVGDDRLRGMRDKIEVVFDPSLSETGAIVTAQLSSGERIVERLDVGEAVTDLDRQEQRLCSKFTTLVEPIAGAAATQSLIAQLRCLPDLDTPEPLTALLRQAAR